MGPKQTYTELDTTYWCKGIWLFLPGFQWCSVPDPVSHATYWCQRYLCPPGFPWCSVPYHILMLGISMSAWVSMVQCPVSPCLSPVCHAVSCSSVSGAFGGNIAGWCLMYAPHCWHDPVWLPAPSLARTRQKLPARPREREGVWSLCAGTRGRSFTTYAQLSSCHKEKIDDWPRGGLAGAQADYGAKSELRSGNLQGFVSSAALKRVSSHLRHPQLTT